MKLPSFAFIVFLSSLGRKAPKWLIHWSYLPSKLLFSSFVLGLDGQNYKHAALKKTIQSYFIYERNDKRKFWKWKIIVCANSWFFFCFNLVIHFPKWMLQILRLRCFCFQNQKREREKIETEKNYNKETVVREKKKHSKLNEK
jgi:hypothetical protein